MPPTYCALALHTTCDACHHAIPINAPHSVVTCDYCGATKDVTATLIQAFERLWTNDWQRDEQGIHYTIGRGGKLVLGGQIDGWAQAPTCERCGTQLPEPAPERSGCLRCSGCEATYESYAPPSPFAESAPFLQGIVSAERLDAPTTWETTQAAQHAAEPVLTPCPKCGAGLSATQETPRATTCAYCGNELLLPDAVWCHLHPVRRKQTWYVQLLPGGPERLAGHDATDWPQIDTDRAELEAHRQWIAAGTTSAPPPQDGMIFGRIQVEVVCPSCGELMPVNGPQRIAVCGQCLSAVDTSRRVGTWARELEYGSWALPSKERKCDFGGGSLNGSCWAVVSEPTCADCGAHLPHVEAGHDGQIACPGCGRLHDTFPAPSWLKERCLSAVQCYAAERELTTWQTPTRPGVGRPTLLTQALPPAPVTFDCLGCGSALTVTGSEGRICTCAYCARLVFLPDAVWLRLFPPKQRKSWFLQLAGPLVWDRAEARRIGEEAEERERLRPALEAMAAEQRQRKARLRRHLLIGAILGGIALVVGVAALFLQ